MTIRTEYDDQPDGIDPYSHDMPNPKAAAERVLRFVAFFGDGRVDEFDGPPLFARDLEAIAKVALK